MSIEPQVETVLQRGPGASFTELAARYLEEYLAKIRVGAERLSPNQLWWRPNPDSNSVGNQLLHLHGNLSLWILQSLGNRHFERDRAGEFNADRTHTAEELLAQLEATVTDCRTVLTAVDPDDLDRALDVQGYSVDARGIVFHAVEHASYHTGQILWIVKQLTASEQPLELYPQHKSE